MSGSRFFLRLGLVLSLSSLVACGEEGSPAEETDSTVDTLSAAVAASVESVLLAKRQSWFCWDGGGVPAGTDWKAHSWSPVAGWKNVDTPAGYGETYLATTV